MAELRLIDPSSQFESSHASLVDEFRSHDEELVPWVLAEVGNSFASYLGWLDDQANGVGLDEDFVPNSTYWLVEGSEIVGVCNLRHHLTPRLVEYGGHIGYGVRPYARRRGFATKMLALSLPKLRGLGIADVRITCSKDNIASAKTITQNGGVLESEGFMREYGEVIQRYWVHHA